MNNDTPADAITVTQADIDCRNAIYKELTGVRVDDDIAAQPDWMDIYLARHRTTSLAAQDVNNLLTWITENYGNQDINHADFRVKVTEKAEAILESEDPRDSLPPYYNEDGN